jgi:hypothetical protein
MTMAIQHYVIKLVSDLRHVGGFRRVLRFPPPIKLIANFFIFCSVYKRTITVIMHAQTLAFALLLDRGLLLTRKLLNQGFLLVKLKSSLRKCYGRRPMSHGTVCCLYSFHSDLYTSENIINTET